MRLFYLIRKTTWFLVHSEVVGSSLNPLDAVVPLRQLLPGILCRTEDVQNIDPSKQEIEYEGDKGQLSRFHYDQLVIASGNIANLAVIPGMADHSFRGKRMISVKLFFSVIVLLLVAGCVPKIIETNQAREKMLKSKEAYIHCLKQNPDNISVCDDLKAQYDAALEAYQALQLHNNS
jgi:NADH dehydrogenase FAD-containing subunit